MGLENRKFQKETDEAARKEWDLTNMKKEAELFEGNKKVQILMGIEDSSLSQADLLT